MVPKRYQTWGLENEFSFRSLSFLKDKFDQIGNVNISTGDPKLPSNVGSEKKSGGLLLGVHY